jgi:hypothetical protein
LAARLQCLRENELMAERRYVLAGVVWLALAVLARASDVVPGLAPPLPQVVLAALTLGLVVGYVRGQALPRWLDAVSLRTMLTMHIFRFGPAQPARA